MIYRFEIVRPEQYSLIEQLEMNLRTSEGEERGLMLDLLGVLYKKKMEEIIEHKASWREICRKIYGGILEHELVSIYYSQLIQWENKLEKKKIDPYLAGLMITRACNIYLNDYF